VSSKSCFCESRARSWNNPPQFALEAEAHVFQVGQGSFRRPGVGLTELRTLPKIGSTRRRSGANNENLLPCGAGAGGRGSQVGTRHVTSGPPKALENIRTRWRSRFPGRGKILQRGRERLVVGHGDLGFQRVQFGLLKHLPPLAAENVILGSADFQPSVVRPPPGHFL